MAMEWRETIIWHYLVQWFAEPPLYWLNDSLTMGINVEISRGAQTRTTSALLVWQFQEIATGENEYWPERSARNICGLRSSDLQRNSQEGILWACAPGTPQEFRWDSRWLVFCKPSKITHDETGRLITYRLRSIWIDNVHTHAYVRERCLYRRRALELTIEIPIAPRLSLVSGAPGMNV